MIVFVTINDYKKYLRILQEEKKSVGFVPTMGALHKGHIALIERAKKENDIVVCSIFVNPTQFNNKADLAKYPRTLAADIKKLKNANCDVLFAPDEKEIYPENGSPGNIKLDFGNLNKVMEGKFRPGHFPGVATVVDKLFRIVEPQKAYFGEKDYQQLLVIKKMTKILKHKVEIIPCPTVREKDGLAMSSRNTRLSKTERKNAPFIYTILKGVKELDKNFSVEIIRKWGREKFEENKNFKLEYFEIADAFTLNPLKKWTDAKSAVACVAVYMGNVRLIDNIKLY